MTAAHEPAASQDVAAGKAGARPIGGAASLLTVTRWLPIPGYEDRYEVSDDGQVRGLPGPGAGRVNQTRVMKLRKTAKGRWQVNLYSGAGKRGRSQRNVHALMLEAFVGPRPAGAFALHADDDPDNNTLPNLRWGTRSENARDMVANGNHNCASKTHCKWGHPFDGENLIMRRGERECRACKHRRDVEHKARRA